MKQPDQSLLVLLLMPLLPVLLLAAATDPVLNKSFKFRQDAVCPPSSGVSNNMKLQGAKSQKTCSVECILRANCAVYTFASESSKCQMASTAELINSWTAGEGPAWISQLNPRLPGILTFRAKLLAFLDFRIGQENLVGSAQFRVSQASPGVTYSAALGAVFPALPATGESNYIQLNQEGTETIASLLGPEKTFSVYARVNRLTETTTG